MDPALFTIAMGSVLGGLAGLVLVRKVIPARRESARKAFGSLGSDLGFSLLETPANWVACGGEVESHRLILLRVASRMNGIPLPPRIDIIMEAGLSHPMIQSGGVLLRPGLSATFNGSPDATKIFSDLLTQEIRSMIDTELQGRFAMSSMDSMSRDSVFRNLTLERWSGGWSGLIVQTWVSLDADRAALESAIRGLVRMRDRLNTV